jgi:hypothetical protein
MDIAEIDAFLAEAKTLQKLSEGIPRWEDGARKGELSATWSIVDSVGLIRAQLRFRCPRHSPQYSSVSVIYKGNPITRLDLVPPEECKPNPPTAQELGLPPRVCGPHWHPWQFNRNYIEKAGFGSLPHREPLPAQVRRLPQATLWLGDRINLLIAPDQRDFDIPPQGELFGG